MSNIPTLLASEITDYLFVASLFAVILIPLLSAIIKIAKIRASIYRYMIWQYALIGIVVFPALWLNGPILSLKILPAGEQLDESISPETKTPDDIIMTQNPSTDTPSSRPISTQAAGKNHITLPRSLPMKALLAGIWLYGMIIMLIRLFAGWLRLRRICLSAESVDGNSGLTIRHGGKIRILLTAQVDGPVCCGLWQPVILLPREMYNDSPPGDLEMALSHELAHIERRDCWTNLLQRVIEAVFFFHPFVWYASGQLTQQREQICDTYVIRKGARIMDYTKFLSRIAEQRFARMRFQTVALFEGRLLQRVRFLLDSKRSNQTKASRWAVFAGAVAAAACLMFGIIRLEAKPNISKNRVAPQREVIMGTLESLPKGNCSIRGKVLSAETGQPVKHAKVILSMEGHALLMIHVANDGTFVFQDIPTGPFCLRMFDTLGFQDTFYNPENKPGKRPQFSLADAEKREDVILRVEPACSITGKIFDENGEPLKGQRLYVHAYAESVESNGQKKYTKAKSRRMATDGSYSLNDLDGRPVYVLVIDPISELKNEYYPPCYYPGTVDRNKAKKVTFDKTSSVEHIDIRLQTKGELVLEGVVTDEKTGNPIPKTLITIHHRDMLFDRITAYTNEQGRYRIDSIGTGEFFVHVDAKPWGYIRTRKAVEVTAPVKTTVMDFTLRRGARISGTFVDENGAPIEIDRDAYGLAYRYDPGPSKTTHGWTGVRNKYSTKGLTYTDFFDGEGDYESERMIFPTPSSFIIKGIMPGKTLFHFSPQIEGQTVKEISYHGENITKTGIETQAGQEIKDVMIVIQKG